MRKREQDRVSPGDLRVGLAVHPRSQTSEQRDPSGSHARTLQQAVGNQAMMRLLQSGAIHAKLDVSQPSDPDEVEADRMAERAVSPTIHRKCACEGGASCPACEEEAVEQAKGIHRKTNQSSNADESVRDDFLQSLGPGQPLEPQVREPMESSFGQDFGAVKIHADGAAASSARSVSARAFTADRHIVFGEGEYSPHTSSGTRLLAHELAHIVQNRSTEKGANASTQPTIKRQSLAGEASDWFSKKTGEAGKWVDEKKWAVYRAMIAGLRSQKAITISLMRSLIPKLPSSLQSAGQTIIDVVDFFVDLEIALLLAIIGLAVGFVEGIVGLVVGLIKLAIGLLKMVVDYLVALMGRPDEYQQDVQDLVAAVKGIPPGLIRIKDEWLERYKRATLEEQVLMGGELVGQIEAFIATFAFAGTKAGQATTLTVRVGGGATRVAARVGAAVLEPAQEIAITIPAVVPKTAAEASVVSSQMMMTAGSGGGASPPKVRDKSAADRFLRAQLEKVKDPKHPLHFLVEPKLDPGGTPMTSAKGDPLFEWRKTTRTTQKGKVQIGRYQANEQGVTVQVGHQTAFASGAPEQLTLEDADLNQLSGQTVESKGSFSEKPAVDIEGVPVDLESAEQWERLGLMPEGTVAKSPKIAAPKL
jgi:uncharacterized protein DUF4157/putative RNase toxin 5 of polymorphic toxin system